MSRIPVLAALVLAASLHAADAPDSGKIYPVPPDKMAEFIAKTGGMIDPPPDGKALVLLDAREKDSSTLSNLLYAAQAADVCMTMADGQILYENGAFLTLDRDRILFEARRAAARLLG